MGKKKKKAQKKRLERLKEILEIIALTPYLRAKGSGSESSPPLKLYPIRLLCATVNLYETCPCICLLFPTLCWG